MTDTAAPNANTEPAAAPATGATTADTAENTATAASADTTATLTQEDIAKLQEELVYWKTHSRKNESKAKDNAAAASKWEEYQKNSRPADERQSDEIAELRAELAAQKRESLLNKVRAEKNIPEGLMSFISAEDYEGMASQADQLLSFAAAQAGTTTPTKPTVPAVPLQGVEGAETNEELTPVQQALKDLVAQAKGSN